MDVSKCVWHSKDLDICHLDLSLPWYDLATHAVENSEEANTESRRESLPSVLCCWLLCQWCPGVLLPPLRASASYFHQSGKQTKKLAMFISHTNPILRNGSRSYYWKTNNRTEIPNGQGKRIINAIMRWAPKGHFVHFPALTWPGVRKRGRTGGVWSGTIML